METLIVTKPKQDFITLNGVTIDFTIPPYRMTPATFEAHRDYLDTRLREVAETGHPLPVSRETMDSLKALYEAADAAEQTAKEALKQAQVNLDRAGMVYAVAKPKPAERRNGESLEDFKVRREAEANNPPPDFERIPLAFREALETAITAHEKAQQEVLVQENNFKAAKEENRAAKVAGTTVAMQWLLDTHPEVLDERWIQLERNLTVWQQQNIPNIKTEHFAVAYYYRREDFHKGRVEDAWNGSHSDEIPQESLVAYGFVQPEPLVTPSLETSSPETKSITDSKVTVVTYYGLTIVMTVKPLNAIEFRISEHGHEGEGSYIPDKVINFELYREKLEQMHRAISVALELDTRAELVPSKPEVDDIPF